MKKLVLYFLFLVFTTTAVLGLSSHHCSHCKTTASKNSSSCHTNTETLPQKSCCETAAEDPNTPCPTCSDLDAPVASTKTTELKASSKFQLKLSSIRTETLIFHFPQTTSKSPPANRGAPIQSTLNVLKTVRILC